jgi:hypothetical protein
LVVVDELVVLIRRMVVFKVDWVEVVVGLVVVVVGAGVLVVVVLVAVEDAWVVVRISKDTILNFVLYPFQCHQSKGPAGGYQGVGEGKVLSKGDSDNENDGVDLATGFTIAGLVETSASLSAFVNNRGWTVAVCIGAVAVSLTTVAGGLEDSVVISTESQAKGW